MISLSHSRGTTAMNGAGFGVDRPAELSKGDDEYDAFRKRMMLAYRFRPNPLVTYLLFSNIVKVIYKISPIYLNCLHNLDLHKESHTLFPCYDLLTF